MSDDVSFTFDGAPQGVAAADVSGCCGQPEYANLTIPPASPPMPTGSTGQAGATGATSAATPAKYVAKTQSGENAGGGKVGPRRIKNSAGGRFLPVCDKGLQHCERKAAASGVA